MAAARPKMRQQDLRLGICFIVAVAVIWTASSVLVQFIFEELDFKSPFLITYLATGLFAVQLPLHAVLVAARMARRW